MSCITLTKGRKLPCKGGNGGFRAIGLAVWENNLVTGVNGAVSGLTTGLTAIYRYELKATGNNYSEEIAADADARTVVYNGTLSLVLHKLDLDTRNEVKMLAMGEVIVFIETYNGDILVVGAGNGAELTGGSAVTGGAKTDFQGFNLTFTTSENEPFLQLTGSALTQYAAKLVEGVD